jgi:hypothetical protein
MWLWCYWKDLDEQDLINGIYLVRFGLGPCKLKLDEEK